LVVGGQRQHQPRLYALVQPLIGGDGPQQVDGVGRPVEAADLTSYWTWSRGYTNYPAEVAQSVVSNVTAKDNVYAATPTFTSSHSCSSSFTVAVSISIFSLSWTPEVCSGVTVTRTGYSSTVAGWTTPAAGQVTRVETGYFMKVPNGTVPKFSYLFVVPTYTWTFVNNSYWHAEPNSTSVFFQNK